MLTDQQRAHFIDQGYIRVPGLLPPELVRATKAGLCAALAIEENDPGTWQGKPSFVDDDAAREATVPARTDAFEAVAEALVGPDFLRGICYSPFLEWHGKSPVMARGFIPVLTYPTPGPPAFEMPPRSHFHIDGGESICAWPGVNFLAVMVYLTDTAAHGGATVVHPGSHRQVFQRWRETDGAGAPQPPDLDFAPAIPLEARAGDAIFMHYLLVHSGSVNRDRHIRIGLNTAVMPHPARPYRPKPGPPQPDWTPMDHTLRTESR